MIFRTSNSGIIKLTEDVLQSLDQYRQIDPNSKEAGGILLGRLIINSKDMVIDEISTPTANDKRSRHSFIRQAKGHQNIIDEHWFNSNGTCHYLGEWHTHPENYPSYSNIDSDNWIRRLKHDEFSSRYLYFIIVGIKQLCIWEGDRRTLKIKKLKPIE